MDEVKSIGDILREKTIIQTSSYDDLEIHICPRCGQDIKPVKAVFEWFGRVVYPICDCEARELDRAREEFWQRSKRQRIERLFSLSGLGPRFSECTFDNWIPRRGSEKAFDAVKAYLDRWPEQMKTGEGLVLLGTYGNGKSHLAAAVVNALVSQEYAAVFQPVTRLMYRVNASYRDERGPSEAEIINGLIDADLLVLDDIGAEKWSEKVEERLYAIIDGRYWGKKPTILTGNFLDLKSLEAHIGGRAFDRIAETCIFIENMATSFRKERARARLRREV